jgi:hypothetical protein
MNSEQLFQHKLETVFSDIEQSYQDETGYYVLVNNEWKKLSLNSVDQQTIDKIDRMIKEINSSQE